MKKFFALLLVLLMSLTATSYAYALYENEMGAAPANPSARLELTAPQYASIGSTIYAEIRLRDIKLSDGAAVVAFHLYWDDSKLSPVILNNPETEHKEMDSFIVKMPNGWENIFSMKTNRRSGKQYYDLAFTTDKVEALVKEDDQFILRIPFKVKDDATGDMLFWTPHANCCLTDNNLKMYNMQGDYAVTEVRNEVTVTFETNGGSAVAPVKVVYGEKLKKPASPLRSGYVFYGWFTSQSFAELYNFDLPVTEDMTLYAGYTREKYTVSFNTRGGSNVGSQTVAFGGTAERPEDPTREGFSFAGWFADEDLSTVYDFSKPVTKELTLYAGWHKNPTPPPEVSDDISNDTSSDDISADTSSDDMSDDTSSDVSDDISDEISDDVSSEASSEDVSSVDETSPDEPSAPTSSDSGESEPGDVSGGTVGGTAVPTNLLIIAVAIMALAAVGLVISSAIKH